MLKLTRTVQIPTTVFTTDNFRVGEVYTIVDSTKDGYITSGLETVTDNKLFFENGTVITAEEVAAGEYELSPTETFLDRWVALYTVKYQEGRLHSSFFVAYDEEDAYGIALDTARANPVLNGAKVLALVKLSEFMDQFGYMSHQSVQMLSLTEKGGRKIYVSK